MEVEGPVTVVAKGAGVLVPVEVTCGPNAGFAGLDVRVTQARGSHVATGFGGTSTLWCDGQPHLVQVLVQANTGAFKSGDAIVEANLFVCPVSPAPCASDQDIEEVRIAR